MLLFRNPRLISMGTAGSGDSGDGARVAAGSGSARVIIGFTKCGNQNSEYRVVTCIIVNPGHVFNFTMLLHHDISLLWERIMGPRTGVDPTAGGLERFFEIHNFFNIFSTF